MPLTIEALTEEALALSSDARAVLADRLVESLDPSEDGAIHRAWATEAQRRLQELRSGAVQGIPGDEALARLRERFPA